MQGVCGDDLPRRAVGQVVDVCGHDPAPACGVEGVVDTVQWLVHVHGPRVRVEDLAEERRSRALVGEDQQLLRLTCHERRFRHIRASP